MYLHKYCIDAIVNRGTRLHAATQQAHARTHRKYCSFPLPVPSTVGSAVISFSYPVQGPAWRSV